ncbi:MAG TPA: 5-(carboxyamino)imidazole ribonucleotide synthase [Paracoccaceae bacterium]|nr:5-(carboxyamino)imidazole ribonucleotide synthase [Paracoccaceae bacterium]
MPDPLPPGSSIGILGGGQLGRMLAMAAARLGLRTAIFEPSPNPPAGQVAASVTIADWADEAALRRFAAEVDVITYEFENVPAATVELLETLRPVRPGLRALATSQDRLSEKDFLAGLGLATAPYRAVADARELAAALAETGTPAILKTRRLGYDGKGQVRIAQASEAEAAWAAIGGAPAVLEGFVEFSREISVIGARSMAGAVACYDPGENLHERGILRRTIVPAAIPPALAMEAVLAAGRILNALDYVGVIGVELFVTDSGLVVNEFAPRLHNSGHWTIEACLIDQFEQHARAVAGWPLGDASRHSDAVMTNLIGDEAAAWPSLAADPAVALHLYGKAETRPGRKMGHVTRIAPRR